MNFDFQEFLSNPTLVLTIIICLDLLFGDPIYYFHPVRIIARLQIFFENHLRLKGLYGKLGGVILVIFLLISVLLVYISLHYFLTFLHWSLAWLWNIYLGWSLIALRDLLLHSKKVAKAMENRNLKDARQRVSLIVGRETMKMDMKACGRAAVESVSENFNDGVLAPLFYYCIFGIQGMIVYKVLNTLDSMIGYKNEKYNDFGWFAAKTDDIMSLIPARISWFILSLTAGIFPGFYGMNAFKIGLRDNSKLDSPNAGWCEATAAGALRIILCGPIWREGKLAQNFWLGDSNEREGANFNDVHRMNQLALSSTILIVLVFGLLLWLLGFIPLIDL